MNSVHEYEFGQICLVDTKAADRPVFATHVNESARNRQRDSFDRATVKLGIQIPPKFTGETPHPLLIPRRFLDQLADFNRVLNLALVNIVERWWDDGDAGLPQRMPLEPHEERLLQWVNRQVKEKNIRPFQDCIGHLRPDILIPCAQSFNKSPNFRVCEINSRFPLMFILTPAFASGTLANMEDMPEFIRPTHDMKDVLDSVYSLFDPKDPIHIVRTDERYKDYHNFFDDLTQARTGFRPRIFRPTDLRLIADSSSATGYILCCVVPQSLDDQANQQARLVSVNGEELERIYQVSLHLFQPEYGSLSMDILKHLALCGVNDVRTIFHLADKRMLGIIHQELDDLVHKHGVLTADEANMLREGIVPTILPGSVDLEDLIFKTHENPATKDGYILKPCRAARSEGIVFGEDLSTQEWERILISLRDASLNPDRVQYIIQPIIQQKAYDLYLHDDVSLKRSLMVGTYHSIHGRFTTLGFWRSGQGRVCSATGDAASCFVFSVVEDNRSGMTD